MNVQSSRSGLAVAVMAAVAAVAAITAAPAAARDGSRFQPAVRSAGGIVAAESPEAADAARQVLDDGGNAMDAAVTATFATSVTKPGACGLGGGGYLVWRSAEGVTSTLDFREKAPAATTPDLLVPDGPHRGSTGHLVVAVPGLVRGLADALARHGTIGLDRAIAPADALARDGIVVSPGLGAAFAAQARRLKRFPASAATFLPGGVPPAEGSRFAQPDLAATLERIAAVGPDGFYRGPVAQSIVDDMRAAGGPGGLPGDRGIMSLADLANYRSVWRPPLFGTYRGRQILTMGGSSSGGIAMLETLNLLEGFDLAGFGQSSGSALHVLIEAQKLAFADRATLFGDPDVVNVPAAGLISKAYADRRRPEISLTSTRQFPPGSFDAKGSAHTTHLSVVDAAGNAVALTCTIAGAFGSAVVAPGTGVVLNDNMANFGKPGTANQPGPGKRPRGQMTPVIVVDQNGLPILAAGGAGGPRIVMGSTLAVVNTVDYGLDVARAIDAERVNAPTPNAVEIEGARLAASVLDDLRARGHVLTDLGEYGSVPIMEAVGRVAAPDGTQVNVGSSDPRSSRATVASTNTTGPARPAPDRIDASNSALMAGSVDILPPLALITAPRLASDTGVSATVPIHLRGLDLGGSGVAFYAVQTQVGAGKPHTRYRPASEPDLAVKGSSGQPIRLSVRAIDGDGNVSPPATARVVVPVDDRSPRIVRTGRWRAVADPGAYGHTLITTLARGAAATIEVVPGTASIRVVAPTVRGGGHLLVTLDGRPVRTRSTRGSGRERRVLVALTGLDPALPHRLTLTSAGDGPVSLDAIGLEPPTPAPPPAPIPTPLG